MCVYGQEHYTDAIVEQLRQQDCALYLIDNKGDYERKGQFSVLRPGSNLRWTKGTNLGLKIAMAQHYEGYLLLNNDVKLSNQFIAHMQHTADLFNPGIIGPHYDDVWEHQKNSFRGDASYYEPEYSYKLAPFVDGTCMYIAHEVAETVGLLDEHNFGEYGWGADLDYCFRARLEGYSVVVSGEAYINHYHQGTAKAEADNWNSLAGAEMHTGMNNKYGSEWEQLLYAENYIQYL